MGDRNSESAPVAEEEKEAKGGSEAFPTPLVGEARVGSTGEALRVDASAAVPARVNEGTELMSSLLRAAVSIPPSAWEGLGESNGENRPRFITLAPGLAEGGTAVPCTGEELPGTVEPDPPPGVTVPSELEGEETLSCDR